MLREGERRGGRERRRPSTKCNDGLGVRGVRTATMDFAERERYEEVNAIARNDGCVAKVRVDLASGNSVGMLCTAGTSEGWAQCQGGA